jgi:hypothetical protein
MMMCQLPHGGVGFAGFCTTEAEQSCDGRKLQDQPGVAQVVELLPCKSEALSLNPNTAPPKKSRTEIFRNVASVCKHHFIFLLVREEVSSMLLHYMKREYLSDNTRYDHVIS